jgi:hypothetical protein
MTTDATMARIWHGWTTVENADAYQTVVDNEVFPRSSTVTFRDSSAHT